MTDTDKCAHDIAVALLPMTLKECSVSIYKFDENDIGHINSLDIVETYRELCQAISKEFTE